jgi:hypothetical protein
MDNPVSVRRGQCVGELGARIEDFVRREAGPSQLFAPRAAFNVFINNKAALTLFNKVTDSGDTWMAQGGSGAGFDGKSAAQLGVVTSIGPQHLQSDYTIQACVISTQNHPIPPRPSSCSTLYRPSMSSFSTLEVYSINDASF